MIKKALLLSSLIVAALSQSIHHPDGNSLTSRHQDDAGAYDFNYDIQVVDGSRNGRQERSDIYNNRVGSYSIVDTDGRTRTVEYTAGEDGFFAVVNTNEPGTASQDPADVRMNSVDYPGSVAVRPVSRPVVSRPIRMYPRTRVSQPLRLPRYHRPAYSHYRPRYYNPHDYRYY